MRGLFARWIKTWEARLAAEDANRLARPFEWGLEWLDGLPREGDAAGRVAAYVDEAVADSDKFFAYRMPPDFHQQRGRLSFTSPLNSPYPDNNTVHATYFPARRHQGRAVVVLPQWNADAGSHVILCKLLNRFGVSALRMSLPYHGRRMPPELERADYHVSSNIGRTIHATRQCVIDARCCLEWLGQQGYDRLGIFGSSLGSSVSVMTAAHDTRIRAGVFNHVSMHFSDVIWTGLSVEHVREGLERSVSREQVRHFWSVISPVTYLDRLRGRDLKSLIVWARYDPVFLPAYTREFIDSLRRRDIPLKVLSMPCGHYTIGRFPFSFVGGLAACRFLSSNL